MARVYNILAIEDEPIYHKMIAHALRNQGYEIDFAPNGKRGIAAASALNPNLIITDVVMPDMNGYEVTRALRRDPRFAHTPILVLTGQTELGDKLKAFEAGADDYMNKPFTPDELVARISILLKKSEAAAADNVQVYEVSHDSMDVAHVVTVHSLRGGVGCSSLSINLAVAQYELWRKPTLLVDAVLTAGQIALMMNVSLKRTWADLAGIDASLIDIETLRTIIGKHESGVNLIAGPTTPAAAETVSAPILLNSLRVLRPYYDYVVIDAPHDFSEVAIHMLDLADEIVMIMAPDLASIRSAVAALDTYKKLGYNKDKIRLIMNRVFEAPGLEQVQVEKALGMQFDMVMPYDRESFIKGINLGKPLLYGNPKSQAAALLEDAAFNLSKRGDKNVPPTNSTPTWQRVSKRQVKRWRQDS